MIDDPNSVERITVMCECIEHYVFARCGQLVINQIVVHSGQKRNLQLGIVLDFKN